MSKILIAEDDPELLQLFTKVLQKSGYTVKGVSNGREVLETVKDGFDLVVSDAIMPIMNGFEMVKQLREAGSAIPVLMITAKDAFDEMYQGFLSGIVEYMFKPINIKEMLLCIGTLLCRARTMTEHRQVLGSTILEADSMTVTEAGKAIVLPQKEFQLLYKMAANPGRIFTRQQLMDDIWGCDEKSDSHTVDICIGKLKELFRENKDFQIVIMRGVGYKIAPCT